MKHDKILSKTAPPSHLRVIPDYLIDPTTKQVGKALKLSRAAMGINTAKKRPGFKKGFGRSSDPLKTFSAEVILSIPVGVISLFMLKNIIWVLFRTDFALKP